jgi:tRNA 2-thiouridine synthesizing protein A
MTDKMPTKRIDCTGLYCPEPLFKTREQIDSIEINEILEVIADDPAAEEDIKRFAKRTGHEIVLFEKKEGTMRFLIRRTK